ncbi:MAG TPA: hypothetical protein VFV83_01720, partial [Chthoniobacteraceae bacterium]|nr:hypothetical protein [Chthoniobacteraceae bacterium]
MRSWIVSWVQRHPVRAGTIAGWYQQAAGGIGALAVIAMANQWLNAREAGIWFAFQGLLGIAALTDFGIGFCIARQTAYSLSERHGELGGDFFATRPGWQGVADVYVAATVLFRRVQVASAAVLVIIYHLVLPWTKLGGSASPSLAVTWYALGCAVIIALRTRQDLATLEGIGWVHVSRFLSGTYMLLSGVGAGVSVAFSPRLDAMALAVLISSGFYFLAARAILQRVISIDLVASGHAGELPGRVWRSAFSMGVVNTGQWLVSVAQVPLIGIVLGPDKVAPFYAAQKIGQTLNTGALQLVGPQLPLFTRSLAQGNAAAAAERLRNACTLHTGIALVVNLLFFAIGPVIAGTVLKSGQYVDVGTRAALAVDYTLMAVSVTAAHFVLASGKNPFLWSTLIAGVINIGLGVALAPRLGVFG